MKPKKKSDLIEKMMNFMQNKWKFIVYAMQKQKYANQKQIINARVEK